MEIQGKTLAQSYNSALIFLKDYGKRYPCPDYNQDIIETSVTIVVEEPFAEPMISKVFPGGHHELQQYSMEICDGILDFMVGATDNVWEYTYHQRIGNQLDFVINELRRNPWSRRAVIDIRDNQVDHRIVELIDGAGYRSGFIAQPVMGPDPKVSVLRGKAFIDPCRYSLHRFLVGDRGDFSVAYR